jgi:hypothetical protein
MRKSFLYITILVLAVILLLPISAFAQIKNMDLTGCEKIVISTVLYPPVNLNIINERALIVDPEFQIPPQAPSIVSHSPEESTNEFGEKIVNSGFSINNATGVYTIKWALEHAGQKAVTEQNPYGSRYMEVHLQSAGLPMVNEKIRYDRNEICKVFELQISEKPIIPSNEEIVQIGYGIITPIIERVEDAVSLNTDQTQRTSDRLSLIAIGVVVAFIIMGIIWHSSRKEKKEIITEYHIMKGQLDNFTTQQTIDSNETERLQNEFLAKLKKRDDDFSQLFNTQVEGKINDLAHVIHHFRKTLNSHELDIPAYEIENKDETFPEPCPCGNCDYISTPFEFETIKKWEPLPEYLATAAKQTGTRIKHKFSIFGKKEESDDSKTKQQNHAEKIKELQDEYGVLQEQYENAIESLKPGISLSLTETSKKIKELMRYGY